MTTQQMHTSHEMVNINRKSAFFDFSCLYSMTLCIQSKLYKAV